jgi:hypothetical protein
MYVIYYVSMFRCWQFVRILVKTKHPWLRVGRHRDEQGGVVVKVEVDCEDDGGDNEDQKDGHQARTQQNCRRGGLS